MFKFLEPLANLEESKENFSPVEATNLQILATFVYLFLLSILIIVLSISLSNPFELVELTKSLIELFIYFESGLFLISLLVSSVIPITLFIHKSASRSLVLLFTIPFLLIVSVIVLNILNSMVGGPKHSIWMMLLSPVTIFFGVILGFLSFLVGFLFRRFFRIKSRSHRKIILIIPFLLTFVVFILTLTLTTYVTPGYCSILDTFGHSSQRECYQEIALEKDNITFCFDLRSGNLVEFCVFSVFSSRLDAGKKLSIADCEDIESSKIDKCFFVLGTLNLDTLSCEKINEKYYYDRCYSRIALGTVDPSLCKGLSTSSSDSCYSAIASETLDSSLCEGLERRNRNSCYIKVALKTEDISLCENLEGYGREKCYIEVALKTRDSSLCEHLENEGLERCNEEFIKRNWK